MRYLANMATNEERAERLRGIKEKRGADTADRLRRDVWALVRPLNKPEERKG